MNAVKSPASPYALSPADGLTLAQQNAVDLLVAGKNDTETAAALNLSRVTVTRWRLYSPEFRASLANQRAAVWGAAADRLRALLPKALDVLAEALASPVPRTRATVALALLKLAGPLPPVPTGPTDPEDIVRQTVEQERERIRNQDDELDEMDGLPDYDDHMNAVRKRFARLAPPGEGGRPDVPTSPETR